ncbi:hypothetical protein IIV22_064L [Invertebrate iridescent virus 22]|uniref:ShKT domain-containing protein n=1 Tax=Invertebrate iridescent virus 22 TaxID=345198 RepID=S6DAW6_9VIRU|nr:hypothetical protein IIV22_064L [Invertebrate iridescent virus 22]CCV01741.1 hypothetical protein IIV22_064L [Invertebrate iridescent virus 22]
MSQTINGNGNIPLWMTNTVRPIDSFESEIVQKIGPNPHYPGPIHNIGGLHLKSYCRIPGVQPFVQSIIRPNVCIPHCLTNHCFEYGTTTRFPSKCECGEKYDCRTYGRCYTNTTSTNCPLTCGTCNHNSNVINY